jgi:HlyD family secretion protein
MSRLRVVFAVVVVALVVLGAAGSLRPRPEPPVPVQVATAVRMSITRTVRGAGKLEPVHKVNVSSNITGTLLDLKVGIGSEVKKGQYLGQIDTTRYRAQVEQQRALVQAAEADMLREQANLSRLRNVLRRMDETSGNAFNVGEREQAKTQVEVSEAQLAANKSRAEQARAALRDATSALGWATLKAPVDGTVLAVNHRVGERVRGSDFNEDTVLVLGSLGLMDVRIDVGEHDVVHIQPSQKARIEIDALPELVLTGDVNDIGRDAIIKNPGTDNEVTNFPVWITIDKPPSAALSGMSAQVTIDTESRSDTLAVPIQAVTVRPPEGTEKPRSGPPPQAGAPREKLEKVVFVVKDGRVQRRKVTTGISSDTQVEITDGLVAGEEVVEGPYRTLARELHAGSAVTIQKPEAPGAPGGAAGGRGEARR